MLRIRPLRSVLVQKVAWGEGRVGEPLDAAHARLHADLAQRVSLAPDVRRPERGARVVYTEKLKPGCNDGAVRQAWRTI
jgi:hypothetical protein